MRGAVFRYFELDNIHEALFSKYIISIRDAEVTGSCHLSGTINLNSKQNKYVWQLL